MIFDPKISALYANDGTFIKTVHCPMALRVDDLEHLADDAPDRYCHGCEKKIHCIDDLTDSKLQEMMEEDRSLCVFATGAAKNIVMLGPIENSIYRMRDHGLPVVKTARSLIAMEDAHKRGLKVVIRHVDGKFTEKIGDKCIVYQHRYTGAISWSGDYRMPGPDLSEGEKWEDWILVADWFFYRPDRPFPLAAYLAPGDVQPGQRVWLEDIIEDIPQRRWNQGNSDRLQSTTAIWNGEGFELEEPPIPQLELVG